MTRFDAYQRHMTKLRELRALLKYELERPQLPEDRQDIERRLRDVEEEISSRTPKPTRDCA